MKEHTIDTYLDSVPQDVLGYINTFLCLCTVCYKNNISSFVDSCIECKIHWCKNCHNTDLLKKRHHPIINEHDFICSYCFYNLKDGKFKI